jgi:hypothetical protein
MTLQYDCHSCGDTRDHLQDLVCINDGNDVWGPALQVSLEVVEAADVEALTSAAKERAAGPVLEEPRVTFEAVVVQALQTGSQHGLNAS